MVSIDPGARRAILDAAEALEGETLATLIRLASHRSVLGEEQGALEEMVSIYAGLGLTPQRVPVDVATLSKHPGFSPPLISYAGRDNVVATHMPRQASGKSLTINGHIDVVPEGAADVWASPPFRPTLRDGRLYGRGAGDMKAGVVAAAMAYKAIRAAGLQPAAMLQYQAVIEEECTGNGALACMLAMPETDAVIIPESGPGRAAMYSAEVGVVWAWVTVTGRPAHVSEMQAGMNAIEAAYLLSRAFKDYEREMNRAERMHAAFRGVNHPVNVNFGTVQGGEWNSSVPTRTKVGFRVGVMLGYTAEQTRKDIERIVGEVAAQPEMHGAELKLEFGGFMSDPCVFDMGSGIAQQVSAAWRDVAGEELPQVPCLGLTDGRFWELYRNTPVAVFGPDVDSAHGIDESVSVDSLHAVTRALALSIAGWCGLEKA